MDIIVCTAVAKNYLALAKTLGDSVKKNWPGVKFVIILADEADGRISFQTEPYKIIEARKLGIPDFTKMAFKYDVIEFSTAVKPFAFAYLINCSKCDMLVYLDPDMYVYRPLDEVTEALKTKSVVLTPHVLDPSAENGSFERSSLGAGIFNLGFFAMRNCSEAADILKWWQKKLAGYCYLSRHENLFYDQKWMNFLPVYFEGVHILKSKAYNIARWNFAERKIFLKQDVPYVEDVDGKVKPAALFHFSGYKPGMDSFGVGEISIDDEQEAVLWKIYRKYGEQAEKNHIDHYLGMKYKYDHYSNGDLILPIHRRLYRALGKRNGNPFQCGKGSFHEVMKKNKMMVRKMSSAEYRNSTSNKMPGFGRKLILADRLMSLVKKVVGIRNYMNLLKYFNNYCYDERQIFLIRRRQGGHRHENPSG